MIDLKTLTIKKAHDSLIKGEYSAVDLAKAYLAEIEKKNKTLNVYLEVFDDVLAQAAEADKKLKNVPTSKLSNLIGIPFAIKDNILIMGRRAGAASKILDGYVASYNATVISKLKEAGAVFLGRTNCDEFAMGGSTENSAYGVTKNPHDLTRVAGGSSGGSAAAVAANMALAALGSDTGGSIREPASFCGVVGMKPTYGAVSRSGLIAMGSSLDCIGPFAKTVEDAEIIFDCIKGRDPLDSTSTEAQNTKHKIPKTKLKIGVPRKFTESEGIDESVAENFKSSLEVLKKRGHEVREISLSNVSYSLAAYYIIMPAEASTNLARFDGVKYGLHKSGDTLLADYRETRESGFGPEVRRRIILGAYVLSSGYYEAYYRKATLVRALIVRDFEKAFKEVDIIATPVAPTPAWKIGEKSDPLQTYLADVFTVVANISGVPAISVPSGFAEVGGGKLPLGVQFMAPAGGEEILFGVAQRFSN